MTNVYESFCSNAIYFAEIANTGKEFGVLVNIKLANKNCKNSRSCVIIFI